MSDLLKVGSFNMRDNKVNRNGGVRVDGFSNAKYVADVIKEQEFDLIGTQELTIKYVNELALQLHDYHFLGSYRYGNLLKFIPYNGFKILSSCSQTSRRVLPFSIINPHI